MGCSKSGSKREVYSYTSLPKKQEKSQVNNLTLHLKKLEKERGIKTGRERERMRERDRETERDREKTKKYDSAGEREIELKKEKAGEEGSKEIGLSYTEQWDKLHPTNSIFTTAG